MNQSTLDRITHRNTDKLSAYRFWLIEIERIAYLLWRIILVVFLWALTYKIIVFDVVNVSLNYTGQATFGHADITTPFEDKIFGEWQDQDKVTQNGKKLRNR